MGSRQVVIAVMLACAVLGQGCTVCCPKRTAQPAGSPANQVIQEFPSRGPTETAWRVTWASGPSKGLYITGAWFKSSPSSPWMRVLWEARVAELFVPYHPGSPRFYDLTTFGFDLEQATVADAGCCGTLLGNPPRVVKEVRDRGIIWKDDQAGRRGEEMLLWGTLDAANYNYVMQYGFRDDGTITFRLGATAQNLPSMETVAHMHNGIWRVDVDLDGSAHDSAILMRHLESTAGVTATDTNVPFNGGVEGGVDWIPTEFTMVHIEDTQKLNARRHRIAYDAMPMREGTARHHEPFTQHDFWVTAYHANDIYASQLPSYVSPAESVTDRDVVLWYTSSMHHHPRDEDGRFVNQTWQGVALIMWGGFDLRPRNLFAETPLHP